jgi:hypothetical protein
VPGRSDGEAILAERFASVLQDGGPLTGRVDCVVPVAQIAREEGRDGRSDSIAQQLPTPVGKLGLLMATSAAGRGGALAHAGRKPGGQIVGLPRRTPVLAVVGVPEKGG